MSLADAKILLNDVLDKQVSDSLVNVYISREKELNSTITLKKTEVLKLIAKNVNLTTIMLENNTIIINKDKEISLLNDTIKQQKKEIRKQKFLKIMGFTAAVVVPIMLLLLTQ